MPTIPGINPVAETHPLDGSEFVATYKDGGWDLYWREPYPEDADPVPPFVFVSHIVDGPEGYAGLRFLPTNDGALVFSYSDDDGTKRKYTRNQGDTWTDE